MAKSATSFPKGTSGNPAGHLIGSRWMGLVDKTVREDYRKMEREYIRPQVEAILLTPIGQVTPLIELPGVSPGTRITWSAKVSEGLYRWAADFAKHMSVRHIDKRPKVEEKPYAALPELNEERQEN